MNRTFAEFCARNLFCQISTLEIKDAVCVFTDIESLGDKMIACIEAKRAALGI